MTLYDEPTYDEPIDDKPIDDDDGRCHQWTSLSLSILIDSTFWIEVLISYTYATATFFCCKVFLCHSNNT